jgi:hypothetical protein
MAIRNPLVRHDRTWPGVLLSCIDAVVLEDLTIEIALLLFEAPPLGVNPQEAFGELVETLAGLLVRNAHGGGRCRATLTFRAFWNPDAWATPEREVLQMTLEELCLPEWAASGVVVRWCDVVLERPRETYWARRRQRMKNDEITCSLRDAGWLEVPGEYY